MEEDSENFGVDAYLDLFQDYATKNGRPEWNLRRRMAIGIFRSTGISHRNCFRTLLR